MKKYLLLLTFFCAILSTVQSLAKTIEGYEILGVWLNAEKDGYIEISKKSNIYLKHYRFHNYINHLF